MAINIMDAFQQKTRHRDFVWPGFLVGTVGALVAPGATGKSFWALEAAMAVACGMPDGDLVNIRPQATGRVVYLAGEDPESELILRINSIGQYLNHDVRQAIAENLILEPIFGKELNVINTRNLEWILEFCEGARLIVFDTLSRVHRLNENSNGDMAWLVTRLEHIAVSTGAAVLYLHHVSKSSAREGQTDQQQAARGASSLIDNVRWCSFVAKMSEDEAKRLSDRPHDLQPIGDARRGFFVRFGVSKQNYGGPLLDQWYERREGGVLIPVELVEVSSGRKRGGDREKV